ncbi:MAG: AI-2E family transporter [Alistipes sp.]|nr:AI-2E family transporter [Alistipes sp.]
MENTRDKYWRYSLYIILLGLGAVIFIELTPFLGGLLGALTIYILLRRQMRTLTVRRRLRRSLAASLLLGEAVVCFLIPLSLLVWMFGVRVQHGAGEPSAIVPPLRQAIDAVHEKTGYDLLEGENLSQLVAMIPRLGQWLVGSIGSFAINVVVLLFVLYFMLIGGDAMERYLCKFIPFNRNTSREIVGEVAMIVRSNAIGIPLLAVIQGAVALVGYYIFGVPGALFWGVMTCVATIIPIVGTMLVWLPLALYLGLTGSWGMAAGLAAYGTVVIGQTDNLARFILQKRMADTHPLVTVFGVVIGLSLFGFMGVIFGPVLLSVFLFCADLFKRRYLDRQPEEHPLLVGAPAPGEEEPGS